MSGQDNGRVAAVPGMSIRRATPDDAASIAEITVAGWQAAYRGILPDEFLDRLSVEARTRGWRSLLESDDPEERVTFLAEREGGPVGFVSSGPPRDDDVDPQAVEVYAIYVAPPLWRTGAGRLLLGTTASHWRARGKQTLVLWVLEANERGRRFYEAMGWRPDGARQLFELHDVQAPEVRYRLELTVEGA